LLENWTKAEVSKTDVGGYYFPCFVAYFLNGPYEKVINEYMQDKHPILW